MQENTPGKSALRRFWSDYPARIGTAGILLLLLPALYAPWIANGRPLVMFVRGRVQFPFWQTFCAPDSSEFLIEQCFNFLALFLPLALLVLRFFRKRKLPLALAALCCLLPFLGAHPRIDKTDYRKRADTPGVYALFAPIPYGPFELSGEPGSPPGKRHWMGCDDVGRDVASRMIYGARVSLAVGFCATALTLVIGTAIGLAAGFYRGWFDLAVMRFVEILLCFPTFLLLLILMALLGDRKFEQSILVVIAVIGLTGWIGLAILVRGEVLKQCALPYVQSCIVSGIPVRRILWRHLLPNILAPVLISFTFGTAGAILSESGLSFLGFGVQPPTASWGGLLRQAFENPLDHWHLTFFPGAALFLAVLSFNFTGEGLRRAFSPHRE